ncbi:MULTISPECIES: outer membrane beta-barrel protein [unclassified Aliivibrio]|uniref:outer membrane beta-barrel protein n=1 Tax=unclassified Aliivibrio TaxID=2645654 RepID=UPI00080E4FB5|nr:MULTISPECIES: outer membrane beta-barrel protein [unclassified Aliivibrio]OCH16741.1 hypothetical protein A6E05_02610 [Aliivibrio sp. 1S165]OCH19152.1 hypothetical protein A6E03_11835 [Aliivibrio sp. 1S128]OCH32807.1 hypothetical protein A6E06_01855 [Aliivibrio sp. 1S175]
MKKISLFVICLTLFPLHSFAEHIVGTAVGYGSQKFKLNDGGSFGDSFNLNTYYRYMINPYIGIEGGWTSGGGGIVSGLINIVSEVDDDTFYGPRTSAFLQYPLMENHFINNFIYTKLGANRYKVDYTIDNVSKSASDIGFEASLGLESRFNFGLGLNIEYKNITNPIIKANLLMVGMSYKF